MHKTEVLLKTIVFGRTKKTALRWETYYSTDGAQTASGYSPNVAAI